MKRFLIVNADDFGLSREVNRGIVQAHRDGIVSSASLMVHYAAARHAAANADEIDLGLHLDLGEWEFRDGEWSTRYERAALSDATALEREIRTQVAMFEDLVGKPPTHIDSHQHVHLQEPVLPIALQVADELEAPLRAVNRHIRYCGDFYGQSGKGSPCQEAISVSSLLAILDKLAPGVTELSCHPGDDGRLDSVYRLERRIELQTLCGERVRQRLQELDIRLISFSGLDELDHLRTEGPVVKVNCNARVEARRA